MNISTARMNAKQLIDFVPKAAYEALLADVHPLKGKPLSLNGQEEI